MIDLSNAKVGEKFETNDSQSCVVVAKTDYDLCFELLDGAELLFITGKDGVPERSSYKHLAIKSKYDPRHWLKGLPDADLFDGTYLAVEGSESLDWYVFNGEPMIANDSHFSTNGMFTLHHIVGIKMPTLNGDEWKLSKISIDELREWQEQNKCAKK